jgi:hypothetical protein
MHAEIDYERYLEEESVIADELANWMSKYKAEAKKKGWIPQIEDRSSDAYTQDLQQRFFMAKQTIATIQVTNPLAKFTTDTPFALMKTAEFSNFVKASYTPGGGNRHLRQQEQSASVIHPSVDIYGEGADSVDWSQSICSADVPAQGSCGASWAFENGYTRQVFRAKCSELCQAGWMQWWLCVSSI